MTSVLYQGEGAGAPATRVCGSQKTEAIADCGSDRCSAMLLSASAIHTQCLQSRYTQKADFV